MDRRRVWKIILAFECFVAICLVYWHQQRSDIDSVVANRVRDTENQPENINCKPFTIDANHRKERNRSTEDMDAIYKARLRTAKRFCENSNDTRLHASPRGNVWSYMDQNTSFHYCGVPKAGCTTWKSIFRFLYKDFPNGTDPARPSDIDRHFVHYGRVNESQETSLECLMARSVHTDGELFMFTRDPYSRLWSAYIDKFFLPDFWKTVAENVVQRVRKQHLTIPINQTCFNDITFEEFLKFVVATKEAPDEHWAPTYTLCSPCHATFDFIGKQETFFKDYKYILNRNSLSFLIEQETFETRAKHETSMLINYNFDLRKRFESNAGCFDLLDVAQRLWKVFQYNGYVHENTRFPEHATDPKLYKTDPITEFSKLVRKTIGDQKRRGVTLAGQKRAKMVEAYKSIPKELINDVQVMYLNDFGLFGYEMEPNDIFGM